MEAWITILIAVASTVLGVVATDIYLRIKNKTKKAIEKRKQEKQDEFKEIVVPCIKEAIQPLETKINDVETSMNTVTQTDLPMLKRANRDSLRNQLFASFRHCDKVGYRTLEDTQSWEFMYASYLELGGNSFIPTLHDQFLALPLETMESASYRAKNKTGYGKKPGKNKKNQ